MPTLAFPETNRSSLNMVLQEECVPLCVPVPNIKKCPQVNMEMRSKLTESHSHTKRHWEWLSFSTCPKAGAQLTFKKKDLDCCFLSLFGSSAETPLDRPNSKTSSYSVSCRSTLLFFCPPCHRLLQSWIIPSHAQHTWSEMLLKLVCIQTAYSWVTLGQCMHKDQLEVKLAFHCRKNIHPQSTWVTRVIKGRGAWSKRLRPPPAPAPAPV